MTAERARPRPRRRGAAPGTTGKVYEGGPHGIAVVPGYKERFNKDLLEFLKR
ncbi:hypothetical protein ACFRQM_26640 [Streptomyces sp. NPDC056831]|uniref:hypothetical protein n=1 Tax=Streptomyces sp. NPDC056831 TaxID=3345954 RepID=UPI003691E5CA